MTPENCLQVIPSRPRPRKLGRVAQWLFIVLWVGLAAQISLDLQAQTLIPMSATWRWRPGTNEASAPVTAWRTVEFKETQFASAPAPFWYGDILPGGTQISGMQNVYGSLFLRRSFVVQNITEVSALRLGVAARTGPLSLRPAAAAYVKFTATGRHAAADRDERARQARRPAGAGTIAYFRSIVNASYLSGCRSVRIGSYL